MLLSVTETLCLFSVNFYKDIHSSHTFVLLMAFFFAVLAETKELQQAKLTLEVSDRMYCSVCSKAFENRDEQVGIIASIFCRNRAVSLTSAEIWEF